MNDDLSNLFEKLNINKDSIPPDFFENITSAFGNQKSEEPTSNTEGSSTIDIETLLKLKSIMENLNKKGASPSLKLLNDLRPFIPQNKQSKIDQYVQIDKLLGLLPVINSDININVYSDDKILLFSLIFLLF